MGFMYLVFIGMPAVAAVGDSGLLLCTLSVERCQLPLFVDSCPKLRLTAFRGL